MAFSGAFYSFLLFFFFSFIYLFILLYNIVLVLPYSNMNPPRVYTCSPSWTPLPPPSLYHPSGSSQSTSPKHPLSCIEPGLAIHFWYDTIHVSMSFSQSYHPLPLPESKRLFYTSVSLLLSHIQGYGYHLSNLHTDFWRDRSGGLVFPSLEEFSTAGMIHTIKCLAQSVKQK